jgi:hypothetical protein
VHLDTYDLRTEKRDLTYLISDVVVRKCHYSENDTTYAPSQYEREPFDTLIAGSRTNIISFSPIMHSLHAWMVLWYHLP